MNGQIEAFLSSMGGAAASQDDSGEAQTTLPLVSCLTALKEHAARLQSPCPFAVGDLVTVRPNNDVKGAGQPHIVVEILPSPVIDTKADCGSNQFLRKYAMRVCHYHGDNLTVHAVDHSCFEPWTEAHAEAWLLLQETRTRKGARRLVPDTPLTEVVRMLRNEGRRLTEAKITWKKGDLVELIGYEGSQAAQPMKFEGRSVGFVVMIDHSDDTTRVVYYDDDGDRRQQWFKPNDLKMFTAVEPVKSGEV